MGTESRSSPKSRAGYSSTETLPQFGARPSNTACASQKESMIVQGTMT